MLNLNAKKLTRLAIVLGLVAAAMMMILTVGVFADTGDTAAAGDAAAAAAATRRIPCRRRFWIRSWRQGPMPRPAWGSSPRS